MNRQAHTSGVTVAMLRAFVSLSKTLNLTETSDQIGATRQTVRRHISDLETIKGRALFSLNRHQYALTSFGRETVADAENILDDIDAWSGQMRITRRSAGGLERARYVDFDGREFYSQQHPIMGIAGDGLPLMRATLAAWGQANTRIEDPAMETVRPYLVVYRKSPKGWICVEIGEQSAYTRWFGWAWSKSAIGRLSQDDNAGDDFNAFISGAYNQIYGSGGVRLDHLYAHLPRETNKEPIPISFQRMLMGCVFPDHSTGLAVLVLMTQNIDIAALKDIEVASVPDDCNMDFEP